MMALRIYDRVFNSGSVMQTIGVQGESGADAVRIDVSDMVEQYPNARFEVSVRRVNGETYPAAINLTPDPEGYILYTLSDADLALTGMIYVEVQMLDGGVRIKSPKWCFYIHRSISAGCATQSTPNWVDDVMTAAQAVLSYEFAFDIADGGEIEE
ncbi:hypothetical protein FACS1894184_03080 [Clostridia bacterium]|nr:hypothetical protein FACS1894184_03080 [Clostridia bacterium]